MKTIVTAQTAKANDLHTVTNLNIPEQQLIHLAANAVLETLQNEQYDLRKPCVLCGSGNNGADGMELACLLKQSGADVSVLYLGSLYELPPINYKKKKKNVEQTPPFDPALEGTPNKDAMSEQCAAHYEKVLEAGIPVLTALPDDQPPAEQPDAEQQAVSTQVQFTLFVDAVYGTGMQGAITVAKVRDTFTKINQSGIDVVAIDLPSGVNCDTGAVDPYALRAKQTVTMQNAKMGILLYPGTEYAGKITTADIGIESDPQHSGLLINGIEDSDVASLRPERPVRSCKGTYGRVLVIGGTIGMAGAAYFAAEGAYRMGAGLAEVLTHTQNRVILQQLIPEAVVTSYARKKGLAKLVKRAVARADAIVIGCGMGNLAISKKIVKTALKAAKVPCIIDADALNMIAKKPALLKGIGKKRRPNVLITPHAGEAARLIGKKAKVDTVLADLPAATAALCKKYKVNVLLKDAHTLVTSYDQKCCYVNLTGNTALATAGSGDILAGMIGGLSAASTNQNSMATNAALAAHLHGKAGENAAQTVGEHAAMARDILSGLK